MNTEQNQAWASFSRVNDTQMGINYIPHVWKAHLQSCKCSSSLDNGHLMKLSANRFKANQRREEVPYRWWRYPRISLFQEIGYHPKKKKKLAKVGQISCSLQLPKELIWTKLLDSPRAVIQGYFQVWDICHVGLWIWLQIVLWPPEMEVSKQDTALIHRWASSVMGEESSS